MTQQLTLFVRAICASLIALVILSGCGSTKVDLPQGKSKGYQSARLVQTGPPSSAEGFEGAAAANAMVQNAIRSNFEANGLSFGDQNADLIVAYLIILQNPASTAMDADYFGYGRDSDAILEEAHERGVIENKRPDAFESGAVVIDILNAKTNQLIYRNFASRNVIENVSAEQRRQRINGAVSEALAKFFR